MKKPIKRLYVAYGSNLNLRQMSVRCPSAKVVGTAVMNNWRLLFLGTNGGAVATVERFSGGNVPVLVWELQPDDESALDRYEGWPHLYRKETVRIKLNGKIVRAMIYLMNEGHKCGRPSNYYFNIILEGYASAGFDVNILHGAAEYSSQKGGNTMDSVIKEQILTVRDTGETNMFDVNAVQKIAYREGLYELVCYLEDHKREYANFILTGKTRAEDEK